MLCWPMGIGWPLPSLGRFFRIGSALHYDMIIRIMIIINTIIIIIIIMMIIIIIIMEL